MENLFTYGTLMCDSILRDVTGFSLSAEPATLKDYSRRSVKGECYPAIMPHKESRVAGVVYRKVPDSAWQRLDRFEGEMYVRKRVRIVLNDGTQLLASSYLVQPGFQHRLDQSDRDFGEFFYNGKAVFQKRCKGYRSL